MITVKRYMEIKNLLGYQDCVRVPAEIIHYAKSKTSLFAIVCDVFNYGYIMGQRAERARRKRDAHND